MQPLQGIRIIDLCNVVMGPYTTQLLADYGADVIKVEPPQGDDARRTGCLVRPDMASLFLAVNRGKRSIVLDLKTQQGRDSLAMLVGSADILVHNIRPQKLQALGLSAPELLAANPQLIHVSLTGFGQHGPYGGRPAYDDVIQGMSGLAALSRRHNAQAPCYQPTITADKTVGLLAASAILAAVIGRNRTGKGGTVEVPMFESMAAFTLVEHMYGATFTDHHDGMGYPRALSKWRRPFPTSDGFLCAMPYTDQHWKDLLLATGNADLADDPRFASLSMRSQHTDVIYETLATILATDTTARWLALLARLQVPCAPILEPEDLLNDPHLQAVGFFQKLPDAEMGTLTFPGVPVLFNGLRPASSMPPRLGQHTETILAQHQPAMTPEADADAATNWYSS